MAATTRFVRRAWQAFVDNKGHDATSFGHLEVLSAKPGVVHAKMVVKPHQANRLGSLHGGVTSSLVDTIGSLSLASKGLWLTGVSTDINVSFVKAAMVGDEVMLKGEVVGQGKTLAFTRVEMTRDGNLLAYGSHTKYIATALKGDKNVSFSEDGEAELPFKKP